MFVRVLGVLARERPDWVVSAGAELAIPVFVAAKLLRVRTMFIESLCRVESPSFTGRLVYPLSDFFFVQWPGLRRAYGPKARYAGAVI
jgi:UDP-N-acetylglucosamine:LPS N-acetylglucosamine transferase